MTADPRMAAILEELSSGRIDAAEASRRIDALQDTPAPAASPPPESSTPQPEAGTSSPTDGDAQDPWAAATDRPQHAGHAREDVGPIRREPPRARTGGSGVERVSVRAVGRRVRVVGEPSVATLSADGPHVLRRNGSVIEVTSDGEIGPSLDGFSILRGAPRNLEDLRALSLGKELLVRVNPGIAVDVEVTAGSLSTDRVAHLGKVRVTAGSAKMLGVAQVDDVLVQAGQATIKGAIATGRNRVRAESGSLSITLEDDSNVTVHGEAQLGRVSWSGGHSGAGDEVVMGNGSARLDVEVVMGYAQVHVGSNDAASAAAGGGAA